MFYLSDAILTWYCLSPKLSSHIKLLLNYWSSFQMLSVPFFSGPLFADMLKAPSLLYHSNILLTRLLPFGTVFITRLLSFFVVEEGECLSNPELVYVSKCSITELHPQIHIFIFASPPPFSFFPQSTLPSPFSLSLPSSFSPILGSDLFG